jgi:hypothetical protein
MMIYIANAGEENVIGPIIVSCRGMENRTKSYHMMSSRRLVYIHRKVESGNEPKTKQTGPKDQIEGD